MLINNNKLNLLIARTVYIWKLKDEGETPSITWNIMSVVNCRPRGVCRLFLTEKLWLLKQWY